MKRKNRRFSKAKSRRRRGPKKQAAPRTAKEYFEKPASFQNQWDRAVGVVSRMRAEGISLQKASRDAEIGPRTVLRLTRSALKKRSNGRYTAKRSDQLLRMLKIPDAKGTRDIAVPDSRQGTLLSEYWNAVHRYLETGDSSRLEKFRGKSIKDADGVDVPLPTDSKELNRLGNAGSLSFESLYSRVS